MLMVSILFRFAHINWLLVCRMEGFFRFLEDGWFFFAPVFVIATDHELTRGSRVAGMMADAWYRIRNKARATVGREDRVQMN